MFRNPAGIGDASRRLPKEPDAPAGGRMPSRKEPTLRIPPLVAALLVALATLGLSPSASAHYDPNLGRWLERDPLGLASGNNLQESVQSAPVSRVDPLGLQSLADPKGALIAKVAVWEQTMTTAEIIAKLRAMGTSWEMIAAVIGGTAAGYAISEIRDGIRELGLPNAEELADAIVDRIKQLGKYVTRDMACALADQLYELGCKDRDEVRSDGRGGTFLRRWTAESCENLNPLTKGPEKCRELEARAERFSSCAMARVLQTVLRCPTKGGDRGAMYKEEILKNIKKSGVCKDKAAECWKSMRTPDCPPPTPRPPAPGPVSGG